MHGNTASKVSVAGLESPEMCLNLRTQLRHGEQRASRCSLGVARSPVHIIFHIQPSRPRERLNRWSGSCTLASKLPMGGICILGYIGN